MLHFCDLCHAEDIGIDENVVVLYCLPRKHIFSQYLTHSFKVASKTHLK